MEIQIIEAINNRNRVSFGYKGKLYKAEIYVVGTNKLNKLAIRAWDVSDKMFKIFLLENISEFELIKGDNFSILRTGYTPYGDKHFKEIIKQI